MPFLFLMPMIMFGGMWRLMDDMPRAFVPAPGKTDAKTP
jgi:hypothetical protein